MIIVELEVQRFGPFTDTKLDFRKKTPGFHLIYGGNEAGKSSALRAIRSALFGIDHPQTVDAFLHEYGALRLGATLRNRAGDELSFFRRKGAKNTLYNTDSKPTRLAEEVLQPFLGSIDGPTFSRIYGIDHRELESGGRELQALRGFAGESLFLAGLGIPELSLLSTRLTEDARRLYVASSTRKTKVRETTKKYCDARKRRRAYEVSAEQWQRLNAAVTLAEEKHSAMARELSGARAKLFNLQRLVVMLPIISERDHILAHMATLDDVAILPASYSVDRRQRAQAQLESSERRILTLDTQIQKLRENLASLPPPLSFAAYETTIHTLRTSREQYIQSVAALPGQQTVATRARRLLQRSLSEIDRSISTDDIIHLWPTQTQRQSIRQLAQQASEVNSNARKCQREVLRFRAQYQAKKETSESAAAPPDITRIDHALSLARREGDLEHLAKESDAEAAAIECDLVHRIQTLGLWTGSLADIETLELPLNSTLVAAERADDRLCEAEAGLALKNHTLTEKIHRVDEQIRWLENEKTLPNDESLALARKRRDLGWQLIRQRLSPSSPDACTKTNDSADDTSVEAYESAVRHADHIADRLCHYSTTIARLKELKQQKSEYLSAQQSLENDRAELSRQRNIALKRWQDLWRTCADFSPLSPSEMREWADRVRDLKACARSCRQQREAAAAYRRRASDCQNAIKRACLAAGIESPAALITLNEAILFAEKTSAEAVRCSHRNEELRLDIEKTSEALRLALIAEEEAVRQLATWSTAWKEATAILKFEAEPSVGDVDQRLEIIRQLVADFEALCSEEDQLQAAQANRDRFEETVRALALEFTKICPGKSLLGDADAIIDAFETAERNALHRQTQLDRITAASQEREALARESDEVRYTLAHLCQLAGVSDHRALDKIEQKSNTMSTLRSRLSQLEGDLQRMASSSALESYIAQAASLDPDQIHSDIHALKESISDLETARDARSQQISSARAKRDEVDGDNHYAEADEEALSFISELFTDAEDYIRLRLADALLRHRLESYRQENEHPIIRRSAELFRHLSCGSFSGLIIDYGGKNHDIPLIRALRSGNEAHVPLEGLSDGSADQLYLALRLAYIETCLDQQEEPLPLILDDILIHFDNDRAVAALEVLAELATRTQIIFFTHHDHLRHLAQRTISDAIRSDLELPHPSTR